MIPELQKGYELHFDLLALSGHSERDDAISQIAWYEGLQLLPQHFQSWDERLEGLLQRDMLSRSPYSWGIDRLKIDKLALESGLLRLITAAGCFPDGLTFAWTSLRHRPMECALEPGMGPVRYALAVPREDFTDNGTSVGRYMQFVAPPLSDRTNRDEKAAIVRLSPNLSIRRWDPLNPLYVQIPFVEVTNTATGFLATDFHPPAVRLIPDSHCASEVASLIRCLRAKAGLLGALPVPALLNAEYRPGLNWILSSLVTGLPRLEAQVAGMAAHPYDIFLSLCMIAGAVSPLAGRPPDHFPAYNHADPGASILVVARFITAVVNPIGMRPSRWNEIPFAFADGEWTLQLPEHHNQSELVVLVAFDKSNNESAVSSWLQHVLICFADEKGRCRETRVRGLMRRIQSMPEPGLDARPGECYIRIDVRGGIDALERRLIIAGSDVRSGLVFTRVSLMTLLGD